MTMLRRMTAAALLVAGSMMFAAPAASFAAATTTTGFTYDLTRDWSADLWSAAKAGDADRFQTLLTALELNEGATPAERQIHTAAVSLRAHLDKREEDRTSRITEVRAEMAEAIAEGDAVKSLAEALRGALELEILATDKGAIIKEPEIVALMKKAEQAARTAEADGRILDASELFVLLSSLTEDSGQFKPDVTRLNQRLTMLRLYTPHRLWEMRDQRLRDRGEDALPPYNSLGDDYHGKLSTITKDLVLRSILYTPRHIEQPKGPQVVLGGIEAVRTLVTTRDLVGAFPRIADDNAVAEMLAILDAEKARFEKVERTDQFEVDRAIDRILQANNRTVKIMPQAVLHEFGNGAMATLDDYTAIIWPDEVRRFQRNTQGKFVGVGVQIEYNEVQAIRVVTPLEGTPAQRAGVLAGDVIKAIDGKPAVGLSLDQAVDVITGPAGTDVILTLERKDPEAGEEATKDIDVRITRSVINITTVKGWKREGVREDDWNWFVDPESKIGYVRLLQFADGTDDELRRAIAQMRQEGLNGLIMDLRFNPGGLLDQAVKVSRKFVSREGGYIVMTQGPNGTIESPEFSRPSQAVLADIPVVVLINEGSASASEIVSGVVSNYIKTNDLDGLVLGNRSFGKGSVQNVFPIAQDAMLKLTIQYYMLPDKSIIHRRPGAKTWGVEPNLSIEMLPKQTTDAITLRRNADVLPMDAKGEAAPQADRPNPDDLLAKGIDLQLETALVLLKARTAADPVKTLTQSNR